MRPPLQLIPERYLRGTTATAFGKLKVTFQFVAMLFVLPLDQKWLIYPFDLVNTFLFFALLELIV